MTLLQRFYLLLADLVLVIHTAFVAFVVFGLLLIWIGWWRRWNWVRNLWFRLAHLAAIGVVVAESLLGFVCPLTTWEDRLRVLAGHEGVYDETFMQHWLHRVMFFDIAPGVFTIIYTIFFLAVATSLWFMPPRRLSRRS